jgi:hypothetical protein
MAFFFLCIITVDPNSCQNLQHYGASLKSTVFTALRHRNFALFISGQLISLMGTWMQSIALSWLVFSMTKSSFLYISQVFKLLFCKKGKTLQPFKEGSMDVKESRLYLQVAAFFGLINLLAKIVMIAMIIFFALDPDH